MCRLVAGDHILAGDECCADDPGDCSLTTVEGDMLREACDGLVDAAVALKEAIGEYEDDDLFIMARYMDVQCRVAELTQQLIAFTDPEAGLESV